MAQVEFTCLFGGEAGYGVMSAGVMVAKGAGRNGMWSFVVNEYPSLIKGGMNTCLVRLAGQELTAYEEQVDFLGALSQQAFDINVQRVKPGGTILYDSGAVRADSSRAPAGVRLVGVPLLQSMPGDGAKVMANSALLGGFAALTGYSLAVLRQVMSDEFAKAEIREQNLSLMEEAYQRVVKETGSSEFPLDFQPESERKMLLNGNDAIAMGALRAGCKFSAGYPMTPGSSVLVFLADHGPQYGLVFKQAEDEIAAVNMLIGAAFAGVRSIGSTSGGGFALMTEAIGFAAQAEIPLVLVNAQRGGPSTGLPTRTAQADLNLALYASQGEFPRIIVAPGDGTECFTETVRTINLAEKFQMPAVILTDKYLADSLVTTAYFAMDGLVAEPGSIADGAELMVRQPYLRYGNTADGISPRAIPGQAGGRHIATSYTHGEDGFYSSGHKEYAAEEPTITAAGLDKLFRKEAALAQQLDGIRLYGPEDADVTVVLWGSTKGAALEAMRICTRQRIAVNVLQVLYLSPFPVKQVAAVLGKAQRTLLVEGNKTGQLGELIRAKTGIDLDHQYLKYDSRPFIPSAIVAKIKEVYAHDSK